MFPNPSGDGYLLDVQTDLLSDFNTRVVVPLPHIAAEKVFALKGGTAINLFNRDLPRLSVDIDLTYLPIRDRTESFADIAVVVNVLERHGRGPSSNMAIPLGQRRHERSEARPFIQTTVHDHNVCATRRQHAHTKHMQTSTHHAMPSIPSNSTSLPSSNVIRPSLSFDKITLPSSLVATLPWLIVAIQPSPEIVSPSTVASPE